MGEFTLNELPVVVRRLAGLSDAAAVVDVDSEDVRLNLLVLAEQAGIVAGTYRVRVEGEPTPATRTELAIALAKVVLEVHILADELSMDLGSASWARTLHTTHTLEEWVVMVFIWTGRLLQGYRDRLHCRTAMGWILCSASAAAQCAKINLPKAVDDVIQATVTEVVRRRDVGGA